MPVQAELQLILDPLLPALLNITTVSDIAKCIKTSQK